MIKTTRLLALTLALGLSFNLLAQDTLDRALLWRIDATDPATPSSYLFGTIHLIPAADFVLSDSLMSVLNRSERVTFEIDPAEMTDPAMAFKLIPKAMMRGDTTLRDVLTAEEFDRAEAHFSELGLPMMFLQRVKPMFLSMLVGMDDMDLSGMLGGDPSTADEQSDIKSYELELDGIARQADKEIGGLETTDFQLSLFDSIPYRAQGDMLMAAIDAPEDGESSQLDEITSVYTTGDIDGMYLMSVGEEGGVGGFEKTLIVNRNLNWIAPMETQIAAGATLFAVGAGHLGGPQGIIRLLREAGYILTPLSIR